MTQATLSGGTITAPAGTNVVVNGLNITVPEGGTVSWGDQAAQAPAAYPGAQHGSYPCQTLPRVQRNGEVNHPGVHWCIYAEGEEDRMDAGKPFANHDAWVAAFDDLVLDTKTAAPDGIHNFTLRGDRGKQHHGIVVNKGHIEAAFACQAIYMAHCRDNDVKQEASKGEHLLKKSGFLLERIEWDSLKGIFVIELGC